MKKILFIVLTFLVSFANGQETDFTSSYSVGPNQDHDLKVHMTISARNGITIQVNDTNSLTFVNNRITPDYLKQHIKVWVQNNITAEQLNTIYKDLMDCYASYKKCPKIFSVTVYPISRNNVARFGDRLEVHGRDLQSLVDANKNKENPIVLYLDNYKLATLVGTPVADSIVNFSLDSSLQSTVQDRDFWTSQYHVSLEDDGRIKPDLKIGTKDGSVVSNSLDNVYFRVYNPTVKWITQLAFIIITILVVWAALKTDLLRENCECNCIDNTKPNRKPFSLSRSQMAFWTIIVAFSFTYIYLITGNMPDITQGTLILLGISSTTTLGGSLIDNNDPTKAQALPPDFCCSEGFVRDILSDAGNPGIHRLQNVLFTIILGIIYISKAITDLEMTNFSTNLLILMGISSGTYLGVKYFANQSTAQNLSQGQQQAAAPVAPAANQPNTTANPPADKV